MTINYQLKLFALPPEERSQKNTFWITTSAVTVKSGGIPTKTISLVVIYSSNYSITSNYCYVTAYCGSNPLLEAVAK